MKFKILTAVFAIVLFASSCKSDSNSENSGKDSSENNSTNAKTDAFFTISVSSSAEANYKLGEAVTLTLKIKDGHKPDSMQLFVNDKFISNISAEKPEFLWDGTFGKTGSNSFEIEYFETGKKTVESKKIVIYPDTKPEKYTYNVKKVYKHDVNAYTQGLFWHNGFLYEATGLKGESTVRKVKLETGEVLQSFAIPTDVFGEGIVLFDNKIVQLSWDSGRGFVYDFASFKQIDEFSYTGEGWGICTDGEKLFMTDGTPTIRILDPTTYSVTDRLEVYDNDGPVKLLNELEYINGEIFANIYQYEKIARIDPKTGKVLAYIDLDGILPMNDWTSNTDVLNGIAYDAATKRLFVTGKKWPKLFEIELVKK